ncbi:MAG: SemiSWEET transporter [Nanoarchaeota archaeon]
MELVTIIGLLGAFCTTIAYFPQAIKVIRTRKTKDLSLWMYILIFIGLSFWLAYGILLKSPPLIIANSITIVTSGIILGMKVKYG